MEAGSQARGRDGWETAAFFAGALVLYLLLRQTSLHGYDVHTLLHHFGTGHCHPRHPAYLPLARALHALLEPLGATPHGTLMVFSALGTACGVAFLHRAALLLLGRDRAAVRWATALAAMMPAVVHFATVAELQGPFFGAVGLCWWAGAALLARPTAARAAVLGVATAGATLAHATGHLLPLVLLPLLWALAPGAVPLGRLARLGLVAGAVHAAVWWPLYHGLRAVVPPYDVDDPGSYLLRHWQQTDLAAVLPHMLFWEWLRPYAAASVVLPLLLLRRRTRRLAAALLAAALVLAAISGVLLPHLHREHGAYLFPLALPLGIAMVRGTGRGVLAWILLGTMAMTGWHLWHPERPAPDLAFGQAALELQGEHPTRLMIDGFAEFDGARLSDPLADYVLVDALLGSQWSRVADPDQVAAWLVLQVRECTALGRRFALTDGAIARLVGAVPAFARAWQGDLPGLRRARLERGPIRGFVLSPD